MILTSRHLPEEDLALFALQLLEGNELERALDHLEHCEECRHEVARFQGDLVGYALAMSEQHTPPAQARERLLKKVAKEKKVVPLERLRPSESTRREAPQPLAEGSPALAERPLRQMAERLAERHSGTRVPVAQPFVPDGDPRDSRTEVRAAAPLPAPVPLPVASEDDHEVFLPGRGRRMFESIAPASEDEDVQERPRGPRGVLIAMAATGWAIAACMAVMAGMQYRQRQNADGDVASLSEKLERANSKAEESKVKLDTLLSPNAMQVSMGEIVNATLPKAKPEGHVAYMADKGALVMTADHLNPLPAGKTYELWLLQPDETHGKPIPAGLFKPDARGIASVVLPTMPSGVAAKGFGVTIEDESGSDHPTSSPILAGF